MTTKNKRDASRPFRRDAWTQGGLDGMCGLYATVNAVQHLRGKTLNERDAIDLFKALTDAVAKKFPALLWEGTGMQDIRDILDKADQYARDVYGFGVVRSEPLRRGAPKRADHYWARLDELLKPPGRVLLVGLKEPWEHWTVLTDVTPRTLRFLDSIAIKVARRADFSIGEGGTYRIDPHQVFLLERVEVETG